MSDDPVVFLERADWRDSDRIDAIESDLAKLGFSATGEIARAVDIGLLARGWRHARDPFGALVYESETLGCWCELHAHTRTADCYVATSAPRELEWPERKMKALEVLPVAPPERLLETLRRVTDCIPLEPADEVMFALRIHDRLHRHSEFTRGGSPAEADRAASERRERLTVWLDAFIRFFRPLGFFAPAGALDDEALIGMVLDYGDPLFGLFPGVADICDDYDELDDFFSTDELEALPASSQRIDVRMLAVLDPDRVRWHYRGLNHGQSWDPVGTARFCEANGLVALEFSTEHGSDDEAPFASSYTILVPAGACDRLVSERHWDIAKAP